MQTARMIFFGAIAALIPMLPVTAHAQQAEGPTGVDLGVSIAAGTDYVWRGLSQTDGGPAAFISVTASKDGFYAGAGTENVEFSGIGQEYDLWGGYIFDLGSAKLDLGLSFYGYVDAPVNIDTLEMKASLAGSSGKLGYSASGYFTFNYFGTGEKALYTEISGNYPLGHGIQLSGALGHQQIDSLPDYNTWNVGVSCDVIKGGRIDVRYHDTDTSRFGDIGKARLVGTLTYTF